MFEIRGVTRVFPARPEPVRALRGVDLNVVRGGLTAVLGASGCGKTTLLRILAGFDRPDGGVVRLDGAVVAGPGVFVRPEKRSVGIVAQEGALFPHLSVAANIGYGLPGGGRPSLRPAERRRRTDRVEQMLELVGLPGYGRRRPAELSGGQQQRVALARALAPAPSVVLLDEPFSALDAALRVELREEVRDLLARIDTTAVLVTHDQDEALSLADHIALMRDGRVVQEGTPQAVYRAPADREAAAFLGDSVDLPCTVVDADDHGRTRVHCVLGTLTVATSSVDGDTVMLRPEQLEIADSGVPATVCATRFFGHDGLVRLRLDDGTPLRLRAAGDALPSVDATVRVRAVHTVDATV
ncbi:ABC transporter ATP-binding protein [Gordonia shandongensis]|uniref:ABC transporter ATP-binding protein n=1 Tax=Gordonia shandongensis TaxID=376351 RepID=UPI0003F78CCE|nr:ABC transporter ATP-binding protein [Gordonia shandongensis]